MVGSPGVRGAAGGLLSASRAVYQRAPGGHASRAIYGSSDNQLVAPSGCGRQPSSGRVARPCVDEGSPPAQLKKGIKGELKLFHKYAPIP